MNFCPSRHTPLDDEPGDYELATHAQAMLLAEHRPCCQGWADDRSSWWMHAKGWEATAGDTCVEMGVTLDAFGATTYWIIDTDTYCDSIEYGSELLYPYEEDDAPAWAQWHAQLIAQLDQAAEAAQASDVRTCEDCGYHTTTYPCECTQEQT
ncbi:MAG: hypothetical protein GY788_21200 [bacterium]|nr:hypothetical protein [bacterium]